MQRATLKAALMAVLICLPATLAGCPFAYLSGNSDGPSLRRSARALTAVSYSAASSCTAAQYSAIGKELVTLGAPPNPPPPPGSPPPTNPSYASLLRAGFHSCATWSPSQHNGGCNGAWLQLSPDLQHPNNRGLRRAVESLQALKAKYPCITFADLVTLAAAVASEASGGPPVAWYPGRRDALSSGPTNPPYSARLPDGAFTGAQDMTWFASLGLTIREGVALIGGGHSIGGANPDNTGWLGTWTVDRGWSATKNKFYTDILGLSWESKIVATAQKSAFFPTAGQKITYTNPRGTPLFRLPSDMSLRTTNNTAYWTLAYSRNGGAFVKDFQRVMQRVLQFGAGDTWTPITTYKWKGIAGTWEGYGAIMTPQTDTDGNPVPSTFNADFAKLISKILDPTKVVT